MEFNNLLKLIQTISESGLTEFSYEENGTIIKMGAKKEQIVTTVMAQPAAPVMQPAPQMTAAAPAPVTQQSAPAQMAAPAAASLDLDGEGVVKSPLVGTFYAASSPEEAPFVKVGDHVVKGQVLGIIEAMKLMNEIESEKDGVVKQILVNNEDVVEYDQPLFVIE